MTEHRTIFRRVFDAFVESRERQAQRFVDEYRRTHPTAGKGRD